MLEIRPLSSYELNGARVSSIEGKGSDGREGVAEEVGDEGGVGGGAQGMTPWGE